MDIQTVTNELARRKYASCVITRMEKYILPSFANLDEFAKASTNDVRTAYAHKLTEIYVKNNPNFDPKGAPKPFMGATLTDAIKAAQEFIFTHHKMIEQQRLQLAEAHQRAVEEENRRNPTFTVGCLKTVISLCELAGVDKVNLNKIFEVCDGFGIDINK